MTGRVKLEFELDRDPDAEAGSSAEAEDEDLTAHPKDLGNGVGCTKIWSHLSESREE